MNVEPVRRALLEDARVAGEEAEAAAERDARAAVAAARQEAERVLAGARAGGDAEARLVRSAELARARRQARQLVLRARRDAYERARAAARDAASALRHDRRYATLVEALAEVARRQLGDDAAVTVDEEAGGLVASAGTRTVDYRLPAIADRCLTAIGPGVEALWR